MKKRGKKTLMESAADIAESVRPAIESAMETAVETAKDTVDKAAPILADGKSIAQEKARRGGRRAAAKMAELKDSETSERLAAKVAAFRDAEASEKVSAFKAAEPKKKGGKLKKLVLLGGLAGLASVVAKRLRGAPSKSNWQSSYTPQHTPTHSAATTPAAETAVPADDEGAASPDEALADRATEPHPDTTPDDPAEVVELRALEDTAASEAPLDAAPPEDAPVDETPVGGSRKKG